MPSTRWATISRAFSAGFERSGKLEIDIILVVRCHWLTLRIERWGKTCALHDRLANSIVKFLWARCRLDMASRWHSVRSEREPKIYQSWLASN